MLKVVDLFSGCGGLSYGFQQAGFKVLLGIDNDASALTTFKLNHQDSEVLHADMNQVSFAQIDEKLSQQPIDLVVGGPPCQGMSLSGPRKFDDPRNSLYKSYIRIVSQLNPSAIVFENVPGLVGLYNGTIKNAIVEELTELGYHVSYKILDASNYGVPQRRKRVFFVGMKDTYFDFETDLPTANHVVTTAMAISDLPPLNDTLGDECLNYSAEPKNQYQQLMREDSKYIYNHVAARHSQRIKEIISLVPDGGNYKDLPKSLQGTRKFNVAWTRFRSDAPSPTIDTGHRHHFHYKWNRVPTVRESARLQSFPDVFRFYGSKTEQARQVGNAVPPILAKTIAQAIGRKLSQ